MKLSELPEKDFPEFDRKILSAKRSYRLGYCGQVNKVFNCGQGSLPLFFYSCSEKIIYVNISLARKSDWQVVKNLLPDYRPIAVRLDYPKWYFIRTLDEAEIATDFDYAKIGYDTEKGVWV